MICHMIMMIMPVLGDPLCHTLRKGSSASLVGTRMPTTGEWLMVKLPRRSLEKTHGTASGWKTRGDKVHWRTVIDIVQPPYNPAVEQLYHDRGGFQYVFMPRLYVCLHFGLTTQLNIVWIHQTGQVQYKFPDTANYPTCNVWQPLLC